MKIADIAALKERPALYTPGNATMWTDEYIAQQLLQVHLNPGIDLASRTPASIERTVDWIHTIIGDGPRHILDLGCGPGLYTERLAHHGHEVTGVDYSRISLDYARKSAEHHGLVIEYKQGDYLAMDLGEDTFDLALMIFTDFGVLTPEEREGVLAKINRALKPGGVFIFDVLNGNDLRCMEERQNWELQDEGFWRPVPYLLLSQSFSYQAENVLLNQHIIVTDTDEPAVYRFWASFFANNHLNECLVRAGFKMLSCSNDILPDDGSIWNGPNVTFCVARKV